MKSKQKEHYDQHTKRQKMLHTGETVQIFRDGNWKPATVVEKLNEPRSYNVKIESESMNRRNRKHLLVEKLNEPRSYNVKIESESMYRRNQKHLLKTRQ